MLRPLRSALQHRLWYHHGLSTTITEHDAAIRAPRLADRLPLLQATRLGDDGVVVPGNQLPALIEEVERL